MIEPKVPTTPAAPELAMTHTFRAIDHRFRVASGHPAACRLVEDLFASLADNGEAQDVYRIDPEGPHGAWAFRHRDRTVTADAGLSHILDLLTWEVNHAAVAGAVDALVLHAAAATLGGKALVLPGRSGAGKSTLVSALVRGGMGYLTDEAAAIRAGSLRVASFPKPVCIEPGSQRLFPDLAPAGGNPADDHRWFVAPDRLRRGAIAGDSPLGLVAFVSYQPGAPLELVPMTPGEAALAAGEHWFRPPQVTPGHLATLASVARAIPCYRLTFGDTASAGDALSRLIVEGPPHTR